MNLIKFYLIASSYVFISSCTNMKQMTNYTEHWRGTDVPGHIYANFDDFNGKQDFNAQKFDNDHMSVKYSTEVTAGKMHLEIKCNSKVILDRDVTGKVQDSLAFDNPGNQPVQFIFKAKEAAGKFDLTY
jgi:hypothetical protein